MNPGDIVFQPLSLDPQSAVIALHELMLFQKPRFAHCGIYIGDGQMIAARNTVGFQNAGATGNIAVPYQWKNWSLTQTWLYSQMGKPYDWWAWVLAAIQPLFRGIEHIYPRSGGRVTYTCSALVATALTMDDYQRFQSIYRRTVTPDAVFQSIHA